MTLARPARCHLGARRSVGLPLLPLRPPRANVASQRHRGAGACRPVSPRLPPPLPPLPLCHSGARRCRSHRAPTGLRHDCHGLPAGAGASRPVYVKHRTVARVDRVPVTQPARRIRCLGVCLPARRASRDLGTGPGHRTSPAGPRTPRGPPRRVCATRTSRDSHSGCAGRADVHIGSASGPTRTSPGRPEIPLARAPALRALRSPRRGSWFVFSFPVLVRYLVRFLPAHSHRLPVHFLCAPRVPASPPVDVWRHPHDPRRTPLRSRRYIVGVTRTDVP